MTNLEASLNGHSDEDNNAEQPMLESGPTMSILPPAVAQERIPTQHYEGTIAGKEKELQELKDENARLGELSTPLQEQITKLQNELLAEKSATGAAQAEVTRIQALSEDQRVRADNAETEIGRLNQEVTQLSDEVQRLRDEKVRSDRTKRSLKYQLGTAAVALSLALGGLGGRALINSNSGREKTPTEAGASKNPKSLKEALGLFGEEEIKPIPAPEWYKGHLNKVAPIAEGQKAEDRYELVTEDGSLYVTGVGVRYDNATHYQFVGPRGQIYNMTVPDSNEGVSFAEIAPVSR